MSVRDTSVIIFYNENNEILLQDREGISKIGEEWAFFGGRIEEGETPEQALLREIKEELDYELKEYEYIGSYNNEIKDARIPNITEIGRKIYVSPIKDKLSKFNQKEGTNKNFFSISEARTLKMIPGDDGALDIIEKYLENKLKCKH